MLEESKIKIDRNSGLIGTSYFGYTSPDGSKEFQRNWYNYYKSMKGSR